MSGTPTFDGIELALGGHALVLPPLSFKSFKVCKARLQAISEGAIDDPEQLQEAFVDVIFSALRRNHPDFDREALEDILDWRSAPAIFAQLMELSVPAGPPGEPKAESPSGVSTGT